MKEKFCKMIDLLKDRTPIAGMRDESTTITLWILNPISTGGGALFSPHQSKSPGIFLQKGKLFPNVNEFFS